MLRKVALPFFAFGLLSAVSSFAAVTGTVMTSDGAPVAGASVTIFKPESSDAHVLRLMSKAPGRVPIISGQSDSKGNFNLDGGKEPVVDVRIDAKGFAPAGMRLAGDDEAGAIALETATLRKGIVTSGGKPVAGAVVIWWGNGNVESIATSAADGSYSVPDPDVWAARSVVIHPDYAIAEEDAAPSAKKRLNLTLSTGITLSGHTLASDGKSAVPAATISIDEWPVGVSGEDGSFTINHAPAAWRETTASANALVGLRARAADKTLEIRMAKPASLTGVIRDSKTQQPVAAAEVRLGQRRQSSGESVFTDAKGIYAFPTAPAGSHQVQVTHPNYVYSTSTVTLVAGQPVVRSLFGEPSGRIIGTVQDEEKRPVAAARVSHQNAAPNPMYLTLLRMGQQQFSGPDGRFVLRGIAADNELHLEATKKGFPSGRSGTLKLAAGERKTGVTITIPRGVALTGRIMDRDGKPVSGVAIAATDAEGPRGGPGGMVRRVVMAGLSDRGDNAVKSASDGSFTVHVKPGVYDLFFKREGFAAKNVRGIQASTSSKPVDVTLEPGVELTGRVTRGGVGVQGVNVTVVTDSVPASTITAPDGSFSIGDLTPGQVMVNVRKQDDFIQQMRTTSVPAKDFLIDLPLGGRITGRVVDKSSHQPITAFDAGISNSRSGGGMAFNMPPSLKSFTSDDGTFVLDNVPPGTVQVLANAPGYAGGRVSGVTVEDGKTVADIELALEPGVKLTGRVTGPDGSPLGGVSVRVGGTGGRGGMMFNGGAFGMTDPSGEYTMDNIESGEKTLIFNKAGYLSAEKTITLSGREGHLDAQLSSGLSVTGVVVTEAGAPVPDATVRAMSGGDGRTSGTDANGSFHLDGLAAGHYTFHASKSGFADGMVTDFDIASGAPVRVVLKTGGTIFGRVTGLGPEQFGTAIVSASSSSGNTTAAVDSTGSYRIDGSPVGTVRVRAAVNGGPLGDSRSTPQQSVEVSSGASVQVDLDFSNDIVISGRVTRQGQPVAGNIVMFNPRTGPGSARVQTTTDPTGSYRASGVTAGTYSVQVVDVQRLAPFTTTYEVKSSATFDIDIRTASVRGRVVDTETGEGIAGVQVQVKGEGVTGFLGARATTTDSSGGFLLDSVAPGPYSISADKTNYAKDVRDITVSEGGSDDLTLKLTKSNGVVLTVVDARDGSQLNAIARVIDSQGRDVSEDMFRFAGSAGPLRLPLGAGTYRVTLFANGYAPQAFTIASPSNQRVALTPGGVLQIHSQANAAQRARLVANGTIYMLTPYDSQGSFTLDPKPGTTTLRNVAAGSYIIQVMSGGNVVSSAPVNVVEGGVVVVSL